MQHFLATKFLAKLKKKERGPPPEEERILSLKADEVFCIYKLVEMILTHLPALDLLVLQMVNRTCRDVVNMSHEFQKKLFMEQDSPGNGEQWGIDNFAPNELRWNPFLEHFAVPLESRRGIRIKRKHLRKHDHAEASWKRMFLSYPTRMEFYACLEGRFIIDGILNCPYFSKVMAENMDFLVEADRACYHHDHNGNRSTRNDFIIYAKGWRQGPVWRREPVWKLPEKRLRSYEELQAEIIENEVCDEKSISENSETLGQRGTLDNTHSEPLVSTGNLMYTSSLC